MNENQLLLARRRARFGPAVRPAAGYRFKAVSPGAHFDAGCMWDKHVEAVKNAPPHKQSRKHRETVKAVKAETVTKPAKPDRKVKVSYRGRMDFHPVRELQAGTDRQSSITW